MADRPDPQRPDSLRRLTGNAVTALVGRRLRIGEVTARLDELHTAPGDDSITRPLKRLTDAARPRLTPIDPLRLTAELAADVARLADRSLEATATGQITLASDLDAEFVEIHTPELEVEHAAAHSDRLTGAWTLADGTVAVELQLRPVRLTATIAHDEVQRAVAERIPDRLDFRLVDTPVEIDADTDVVVGRVTGPRLGSRVGAPVVATFSGPELRLTVDEVEVAGRRLGQRRVTLPSSRRVDERLRPLGDDVEFTRVGIDTAHVEVDAVWTPPKLVLPWHRIGRFLNDGEW